jgi:transposase
MNQRNKRSFTREFKHEAASLVVDQGYSMAEACRAMGVGSTALRRWVQQLQDENNGLTPKSQALTPEQRRIQELEKQVQRLEREKSILKKATALLISDEIQHLR